MLHTVIRRPTGEIPSVSHTQHVILGSDSGDTGNMEFKVPGMLHLSFANILFYSFIPPSYFFKRWAWSLSRGGHEAFQWVGMEFFTRWG